MKFNFSTYKLDPVTLKAGNNLEFNCLKNSIKTKNPYKAKTNVKCQQVQAKGCVKAGMVPGATASLSDRADFFFGSIESVGPRLIDCFDNRLTLKTKTATSNAAVTGSRQIAISTETVHRRERFSTHSDVMIAWL